MNDEDIWMVARIRSVLEGDGVSSNVAERQAKMIVVALAPGRLVMEVARKAEGDTSDE